MRGLFSQETERRVGKLRTSCVAFVVRNVSVAVVRMSVCLTLIDGFAHRVNRDSRYHAREEEPGDTNRNRECARETQPRYDIAIANREAGDSPTDHPSRKPITSPRAT